MKKIFIALLILSFLVPVSAKGGIGKEIFYTLDNEEVSYDKISSSPKVVLFIWTTWCYLCRIEMIRMNKGFTPPDNVKFFYVNLGEKKTRVESLIDFLDLNENITKNILLDPGGMLSDKFYIMGVPTYVFLKDGNAVYKTNIISDKLIKEVFEDE